MLTDGGTHAHHMQDQTHTHTHTRRKTHTHSHKHSMPMKARVMAHATDPMRTHVGARAFKFPCIRQSHCQAVQTSSIYCVPPLKPANK